MLGENTNNESKLGLDALEEDFSINLEGDLVDLKPPVTVTTDDKIGTETKKEIKTITSEGTKITDDKSAIPEIVAGEEDKDKTPEGNVNSSSPGLSKIYSSLATHLSKEGVLPSLNEESDVTDAGKLAKAINSEIESRVGTIQNEYKKAMESGVPQNEFVNYQKVAQQLNSITSEMIEADDENAIGLRKNIIAQDFLNRGFKRDEAVKYAQRSIDLAEDVGDSKVALERLKENNIKKYNDEVTRLADEETEVQDNIKKFVENTDEVIKGIKINKRTKDELINTIITPVDKGKDGKPINAFYKAYNENPIKHQVIQNYLFMITKGYTDFSKINNTVTTKISKDIDEVLKNNGTSFLQNGGVNFNNKDDESTFSLGGDLQLDI